MELKDAQRKSLNLTSINLQSEFVKPYADDPALPPLGGFGLVVRLQELQRRNEAIARRLRVQQ